MRIKYNRIVLYFFSNFNLLFCGSSFFSASSATSYFIIFEIQISRVRPYRLREWNYPILKMLPTSHNHEFIIQKMTFDFSS